MKTRIAGILAAGALTLGLAAPAGASTPAHYSRGDDTIWVYYEPLPIYNFSTGKIVGYASRWLFNEREGYAGAVEASWYNLSPTPPSTDRY